MSTNEYTFKDTIKRTFWTTMKSKTSTIIRQYINIILYIIMKYLWVYLWTQNKKIEIPGRIFFVFINVATVEGHFVDTNRDTRKYSDNSLIIQNILIIIIVGTFVGTKLNSVYIISNQATCNSPPKHRKNAEFLTKMSQKAPFP